MSASLIWWDSTETNIPEDEFGEVGEVGDTSPCVCVQDQSVNGTVKMHYTNTATLQSVDAAISSGDYIGGHAVGIHIFASWCAVVPSSARVQATHDRVCVELCKWEIEDEVSVEKAC